MRVNPCKGCDKRELHCHGTCKAYQDWAEELRITKEKMRKQTELETASWYARNFLKGV